MKNTPCYDAIVRYLSGFNVGDSIQSDRIISEILGWDRQTVRGALKKLEALGVIEIAHGKRTRIISDPLEEEEHW